jgi:hypothetical protein
MDLIRKRLRESLLMEKMVLKNYDEYVKLVAEAYEKAKDYDSSVLSHWKALNASNYTLFQRLLSKVNVIFTTNNKSDVGTINIAGRDFKIEYIEPGDEYKTASEMRNSFESTGILKISIDYSEHPVFSVADNIVFRTIHDYMAHILGGHDFGAKGEIASYNRHAKLAPKEAIPALFTEVIGQACVAVTTGTFPKQKIAVLEGFDFYSLGKVDDENYEIIDKTLIKKSEKDNLEKQKELDKQKARQEPVALKEPVKEPELEVGHVIKNKKKI